MCRSLQLSIPAQAGIQFENSFVPRWKTPSSASEIHKFYPGVVITILSLILLALALLWAVIVLALRVGLGRLAVGSGSRQPSVTVLVAARNEEKSIGQTVNALLAQDYPLGKLEIIVIDDGSTDRTAAIVQEYLTDNGNLRLVTAPPIDPGIAPKKNALLAGIAASSGEIILTTDADCTPGTDWVKGMVSFLEEGTVAVVGYSPVSGGVAAFDAFVNGVIAAGSIGLGKPTTAVGRNFAYRREAFEAIGGFGMTIQGASGDDDLLLQRFASTGGKVAFATDPATFVPATGAETFGDWLTMKRRHLSAGARYSPGLVALFVLLYLFHAGLIASIVTSFADQTSWWLPASIWGMKVIADLATLQKGAEILHQRRWLWGWLVAEIVSPFLVVFVTPLALVGKVKWKGRDLKR